MAYAELARSRVWSHGAALEILLKVVSSDAGGGEEKNAWVTRIVPDGEVAAECAANC